MAVVGHERKLVAADHVNVSSVFPLSTPSRIWTYRRGMSVSFGVLQLV